MILEGGGMQARVSLRSSFERTAGAGVIGGNS